MYISLPVLSIETQKPAWLRVQPKLTQRYHAVKDAVAQTNLNTVCVESKCPNISACWSAGTATFMVMGDTCTRGCRFCHVKTKYKGEPLNTEEPTQLAHTVERMGLDYVVITSVDRDDLPDGGAQHFADCIRAIKKLPNNIFVEVLIPDFQGDEASLQCIVRAQPDVIAHNLETTQPLQKKVRDVRANYEQSLTVLRNIKTFAASLGLRIFTKSSLILGFGEQEQDIMKAMRDLRKAQVDMLTIGQYLRPSKQQLPVTSYVHPERFTYYREQGETLGFLYVAAGPFVRSSYLAGELFVKHALQQEAQP